MKTRAACSLTQSPDASERPNLGPCALCLFKSEIVQGAKVLMDLEGNHFSACRQCFESSISRQKEILEKQVRSVVGQQ